MTADAGRALSFGSVAADYDRFRPRTPAALLDWIVPAGATDALDLAAGTGAQTGLLAARVPRVTAVEPDGGRLAVLGNGMDWDTPWLVEIRDSERPHDGPAALRRSDPRFGERLPAGAPFGPVTEHDVGWTQPMTPDDIVGVFGTYSAVITASPERRAGSEGRIREVLATHGATRGRDVIDVPMRSWCWRTARAARA